MYEKIFRKEYKEDENLKDFWIFWLQFLLKNHYLKRIMEENPKMKIYFSRGWGGGSSHCSKTSGDLGFGGLKQSLESLNLRSLMHVWENDVDSVMQTLCFWMFSKKNWDLAIQF